LHDGSFYGAISVKRSVVTQMKKTFKNVSVATIIAICSITSQTQALSFANQMACRGASFQRCDGNAE
jgi:hypothetical protein